ncbi:MAG: sulfotransferase [Calditrichia bacterium]
MLPEIIAELNVRHTCRKPVFVLGAPRSGTSVMVKLLRKYLKVNFGTESQFIIRLHRELWRYGDLKQENNMRHLLEDISSERCFRRWKKRFGFELDVEMVFRDLTEYNYSGALQAIFQQFAAYHGMQRWGDKTPAYLYDLDTLHQLFPDAQYIHIVRDGRDVALSAFATPFGEKNLYKSAVNWRQKISLAREFRRKLPPGRFIEIRYEDLLCEPLLVFGWLIKFLRIEDPDKHLIGFIETHVKEDLRSNNVYKWKRQGRADEMHLFDRLTADLLERYGYESRFSSPGEIHPFRKLYYEINNFLKKRIDSRYWADNLYKSRLHLRTTGNAFKKLLYS